MTTEQNVGYTGVPDEAVQRAAWKAGKPRKRRRKRGETAAYRDGVVLASLFTAENTLLRMGSTRGLPESKDVSRAIVALGDAIKKVRARVDTRTDA